MLILLFIFNLVMVFVTPEAQTVSAAAGWSAALALAIRRYIDRKSL